MSRILVVDDELSMREFLEIFFLQNGHEVVLAEDGTEAVQPLHEHEFDLLSPTYVCLVRMEWLFCVVVVNSIRRPWSS